MGESAAPRKGLFQPHTKREPDAFDTRHIDVLDGIRALAILVVVWFHFWQQCWITPYFRLPFLETLGRSASVSLDFIPRSGYLFVDWMLFLSAFCLFLPHARAMVCGERPPDARQFYKKRIVRIVPCYYLSVFVILFAYALPQGVYSSLGDCLGDLLPTLTFTQTFFPRCIVATRLNGVLWTAALEMQFYLLFPLLAAAFRKKPLVTFLCMYAVALFYLNAFALRDTDSLRFTLNQLPAFFGVFANGMAASLLFVLLAGRVKRSLPLSLLSFALLTLGLFLLVRLMKQAPNVSPVQVFQAAYRHRLSLVFALITLSAASTFRVVRFLFSNAVMRFLAAISYNLYIWHQWLAVRFKDWRIPHWAGDVPPNQLGDTDWQWRYALLILGVSLAAATLATYAFERPMTRLLLRNSAPVSDACNNKQINENGE